jgi:hypothetical protein
MAVMIIVISENNGEQYEFIVGDVPLRYFMLKIASTSVLSKLLLPTQDMKNTVIQVN